MPEPTPRKNCLACGATACFDETCDQAVVARADAFAALAPGGFFSEPFPASLGRPSWVWVLNSWAGKQRAERALVSTTIQACMKKYPRLRQAFTVGDFSGWPELDAALRLGGYEAMLDVVATMILKPKNGVPEDGNG